jgi:ribosomal protein L11 methyltransferase
MRWAEISLDVRPSSVEPVSAALTEAGCAGVAILDPHAVSSDPYAQDERPSPSPAAPCVVTGYLPVDDRLEGVLTDLQRRLGILAACRLHDGGEITLRTVDEDSWADAWKTYFKPLRVGRHFVIKPSWEEWLAAPGDRVIEIDPGMAFGTGGHPTTRLCLQLLEKIVQPGDRVLDWGTGSGVLAVGAALLGAREVIAVDLDPVAVRAAGENAQRNGYGGIIRASTGSIEEISSNPPFDRVTANILASPIIAGAAAIREHLRCGGQAIASGVIDQREEEVVSALEGAGLTHLRTLAEEEWRAFLLEAT